MVRVRYIRASSSESTHPWDFFKILYNIASLSDKDIHGLHEDPIVYGGRFDVANSTYWWAWVSLERLMRSDDRHRHQPRSRNSLSLAHLMAETSLLQYEAPCRQLSTLLIGRSTYNKILIRAYSFSRLVQNSCTWSTTTTSISLPFRHSFFHGGLSESNRSGWTARWARPGRGWLHWLPRLRNIGGSKPRISSDKLAVATCLGLELCMVAEVTIYRTASYHRRCFESLGVCERRATRDGWLCRTSIYISGPPINVEDRIIRRTFYKPLILMFTNL